MSTNLSAYVSSSEGMELLGVDRSTFFYHVEKGEIGIQESKGKGESTRRHRTYSRLDILNVREYRKKKRLARFERLRDASFTLDWMYPRDLTAALDLDYIVFDKRIIASFDTYETWLSKNPHIAMCAYDKKDRRKMLAYVAMLPLQEHTIMEVVTGQRDEMDIRADEILTYDQPGEYTLLANSAVTHPDRPDLLYQVLTHLMQFWIEQYPTHRISRIYAQAASAAGDVLISKLYFAPLYYIVNNQAQVVKDAYVLDMGRPGASKVVRHFQKSLADKMEEMGMDEIALSSLPPLQISHQEAQETPIALAPITTTEKSNTPRQPRLTRSTTAQDVAEISDGWMTPGVFARLHGMREAAVNDAIRDGAIQAHEGTWKIGKARPKHALDPHEQASASRYFSRSGVKFTACSECPHDGTRPAPTLFDE